MRRHHLLIAALALLLAGSAVAQEPQRPRPEHRRPIPENAARPHRHPADTGRHHRHLKPYEIEGPQRMAVPELVYDRNGVEQTIATAFRGAKKTVKRDKWTEVYDGQNKLMGYAVYSTPESDTIRGYNAATPVLVALSTKQVITGVYMLPNLEGPRYVKHIEEQGFMDSWNGLTVKKSKKKKVDTVSGATYTSRALYASVQAALKKL